MAAHIRFTRNGFTLEEFDAVEPARILDGNIVAGPMVAAPLPALARPPRTTVAHTTPPVTTAPASTPVLNTLPAPQSKPDRTSAPSLTSVNSSADMALSTAGAISAPPSAVPSTPTLTLTPIAVYSATTEIYTIHTVARDANDLGHVVGYELVPFTGSGGGTTAKGRIWKDSQAIDLGNLGGAPMTQVCAINNAGQVVGVSEQLPGTSYTKLKPTACTAHAFGCSETSA